MLAKALCGVLEFCFGFILNQYFNLGFGPRLFINLSHLSLLNMVLRKSKASCGEVSLRTTAPV